MMVNYLSDGFNGESRILKPFLTRKNSPSAATNANNQKKAYEDCIRMVDFVLEGLDGNNKPVREKMIFVLRDSMNDQARLKTDQFHKIDAMRHYHAQALCHIQQR